MIPSLLVRLKSLVFDLDEPSGATARKARDATAPPLRLPLPGSTRVSTKMQAGTLQMIGLEPIRAVLGADWPAKSEKVHFIVDGLLRQRLEPGDVHHRLDNDEYLILFVRLTHEEAKIRARAIADELRRLLLGELPQSSDISIASSVVEVDRDFVLKKVGTLGELVRHIKARGSQVDANDVTLFDAEPLLETATDERHDAKPVTGPGPDLVDLDLPVGRLFQKKKSAVYLKECEAGFAPSFSVRRRTFGFYAVVVTHGPTGLPAGTDDPLLENPEELSFLLDRFRQTTALLGLHRMIADGQRGLITIPVSFATLAAAKTRNQYLAPFKDLPPGLFRSLCISIDNIPNGTPASRVAEAITYVQPFCGTRILGIEPDTKLIDLYAGTGCQCFETALPTRIQDTGARLQVLSAFAKRAAWHKLESVLSNVTHPDDIMLGTSADFGFLRGDAVARPIPTPGHRLNLRADHIPQRPAPGPPA